MSADETFQRFSEVVMVIIK